MTGKKLKFLGFGIVLIYLASVMIACGDSAPPPPQKKRPTRTTQKKAPAKTDQSKAQEQTKEEGDSEEFLYTYNPIGKRDPFEAKPLREIRDKRQPRTPLEEFSIGQLKITAIVTGIGIPKAMVKAPDGKSYIVRKGDLIGKNLGRVAQIKRDEVIVIEEYHTPEGRLIQEEIPMRLREEEEEADTL